MESVLIRLEVLDRQFLIHIVDSPEHGSAEFCTSLDKPSTIISSYPTSCFRSQLLRHWRRGVPHGETVEPESDFGVGAVSKFVDFTQMGGVVGGERWVRLQAFQ